MSVAEKLKRIGENEQKVFNAGGKSEYDRFWDAYQQNGTLTDCIELFAGRGWTEETFKPKYKMKPYNAERMFHYSNIKNLRLGEGNTTAMDFSAMDVANYMFAESLLESVDVVDLSNVTSAVGVFYYVIHLHTIGKLILNANGATVCSGSLLEACPKLQNVTIEGMIAESTRMSGCTSLSRESITSIIGALSASTTGLILTLPSVAVTNAFGSAEAEDWIALVNTKTNWTITLI